MLLQILIIPVQKLFSNPTCSHYLLFPRLFVFIFFKVCFLTIARSFHIIRAWYRGGEVLLIPPGKVDRRLRKFPSYHASVISNILNLRKSKFYTIRLQDKGIRKFEFVEKNQFLWKELSFCHTSGFLILISLQPNLYNLWYFQIGILC